MSDKNLSVRAWRSTIALPGVVLIIIPGLILWMTDSFKPGWGLSGWLTILPFSFGLILLGVGLTLLISTIRLFANRGKGTLAPWDPPKHLVVEGPYRYVRNPMHSGVFIALYGEGLLFGSVPILIFVTAVFVFHWFYIPLMEERWLKEKFGEEYLVYKRNVPAWIPRLKPWKMALSDLQISYHPANETTAREFVGWQYEPPYDFYNSQPEEVEKLVQYNIDPANNVYAMFDQDDKLVGYCSYGRDAQVPGGDYSEEALDIGMMIKPELTGQGLGATFAGEVIKNGVGKYAPKKLRVTIAAFNKRAMRVWQKNGFKQTQTFKRDGGGMEFVIMTNEISN